MKTHIEIIAGMMLVLCFVTVSADRMPLSKPDFGTELGDTSMDNETGQRVPSDSEATVTFDNATGTYHFRFKASDGNWHQATWTLASNIDVQVKVEIRVPKLESAYEYTYYPIVLDTSKLAIEWFVLETLSPILSSNVSGQGWSGQQAPAGWEKGLWTWSRLTETLSQKELKNSGSLLLSSKGLPSPMPCWIRGDTPGVLTDREFPYSIDRFYSTRYGLLTDAATGFTVAPGLETVELPTLMQYFDTSIEQGWLEEGAYRDELKTLLASALLDHESGETAQVLHALKTIQEKVGAVYAQEDSPILSEAYALLHFNIAYLLENYEKDLVKKDAVKKKSNAVSKE